MSAMREGTARVSEELERARLAEDEHRAQRDADRRFAADAAALCSRKTAETHWLLRSVIASGVAVALVLAAASWQAAQPVAFAWARTYAAMASPALVCGGGSYAWLPPGPSVWGLLWDSASTADAPAASPLAAGLSLLGGGSLQVFFFAQVAHSIANAAAWVGGGWACTGLATIGAAILWLGSAFLLWVSPTLLGVVLLAACMHGAWAQMGAVAWALLTRVLPFLVLCHGAVAAVWWRTLPRATSAAELKAAFLEARRLDEARRMGDLRREPAGRRHGVGDAALTLVPLPLTAVPRALVVVVWPAAATALGAAAAYFAAL